MSRDKIKIIEFGMDDGSPPPAETGGGVKVVEYGDDRGGGRKRVATAADVGRIKIVEFDDDREAGNTPPPERPAPPAPAARPAKRTVGPVKIRDFDKESEDRKTPGGGPRIKIMEFD